jgi:CubicO group peptidase (beta-lactamase class C family)
VSGTESKNRNTMTQRDTRPLQKGFDEALIRRLFIEAVDRSGALGAQLSIIKAQDQVHFAAGLAHAQRNIPMTPETLLKIGSISKVFNAMLVMSLFEEGQLDINTPVLQYLPEFAVSSGEATKTLTMRQLVSMSSGLDNGPYAYFGGGDDALALYVASLVALPQHFKPGRYFGYSNAGVCIAGLAASRVAGKCWERLLRERILEPGALARSAVLEADVLYQMVSAGHERSADGRITITDPSLTLSRSMAPSGDSLAMCAGDLARFGMALVSKGRADSGARLLSEDSVRMMLSPQTPMPIGVPGSAYCIGCGTALWNGVRVFGHSGATRTSSSALYWIPEQEGCIAFSVNTNSAMGKFSEHMFQEVLCAAFGVSKPRIDCAEGTRISFDPDRYTGVYQQSDATMIIVRGERHALHARYVPHNKILGIEQHATLRPLGGDRFLFDRPCGVALTAVDTAFFGDDSDGRATNMLNLAFPMRRIG